MLSKPPNIKDTTAPIKPESVLVKSSIKSNNIPNLFPRDKKLKYMASGMSEPNTLEPSRGGIGIMLNKPSTKFICINPIKNWNKIAGAEIKDPNVLGIASGTKINMPTKASKKFERGPANAVNAISCFGYLKLFGLTMTGFAQPNLKNKMKIKPIGSMCFKGFKVSLPSRFAVLSPSQ